MFLSVRTKNKMKLYDVLQIQEDASGSEIKQAYITLARRLHPDKNDSPTATQDFRALHAAYCVLKDPVLRTRYNLSGDTLDIGGVDSGSIPAYSSISKEDLEAFESTYKHSQQEHDDVLEYYARFNGNMSRVLKYIPCAMPSDRVRFLEVVRGQLSAQKNMC